MERYVDTSRSFPHCPGCGHPQVLRALGEALDGLGYPPERLVAVTDIGCVGLADPFFPGLHTVHTLHGRSVAVAAGLAMGAAGEGRPLKPFVLIGDGGSGIGLLHFIHAAQTNVNVTVLVHNNLIYGMTGGQHSVLTPPGLLTATTPGGCSIPPLDLGALLIGAGAGFFARTTAPGEELVSILGKALAHPGFSCVEIYELCPAFATKKGGVTGKDIRNMAERLGRQVGILRSDASRPVFGGGARSAVSAAFPWEGRGVNPQAGLARLDRKAQIVIAGQAGERVQSSAMLAAEAAMTAGLNAAVRTDNPVTQGTGFSLAEITVSPSEITYIGGGVSDVVIATAADGLKELSARGLLGGLRKAPRTVVDADLSLEGVDADAAAFRSKYGAKQAALGALIEEIDRAGWWDRRAWALSVERIPQSRRKDPQAVLEKALKLDHNAVDGG